MVTQLHIHVYIIFSPIVVLRCKYLDIDLSATQQDLMLIHFKGNSLYLLTPSSPTTPLLPPWQPHVCFPSL